MLNNATFHKSKRGFHADEMFSYGSANYKYDNVFCPYGDRDYINRFMNDNIKNIGEIKKIFVRYTNAYRKNRQNKERG